MATGVAMSTKKSTVKEYQQSLIDAYYDYKMREMLEPLYEACQQWKSGKLEHDDITECLFRSKWATCPAKVDHR